MKRLVNWKAPAIAGVLVLAGSSVLLSGAGSSALASAPSNSAPNNSGASNSAADTGSHHARWANTWMAAVTHGDATGSTLRVITAGSCVGAASSSTVPKSADADSTDVVVVLNAGDANLKPLVRVTMRGRDVLDDRLEERLHRAAGVIELFFGVTALGAGVNHREIQLFIRRVQRDE